MPRDVMAETDSHREQLRQVITSALAILGRPRTKVRFDFTRTKMIYPGGMLLFLAYLQLMLLHFPGRVKARCFPQSLAAQLMRHFGVADQLGVAPAGSQPHHESVVNWRYLTGDFADGEKIAELIDGYRRDTSAKLPDGLYDVLAEALTNVRHHAYPADTDVPESMRRWWLFARYVAPKDDQPGNLFVAVYDIGVGIQHSMRTQLRSGEIALDKTDEVLKLLGIGAGKRLDRLLLERAVEHPRSSTGLSFRGRGLPEMRDFVLATNAGRLYIISGNAQYTCLGGSSAGSVANSQKLFNGTLILWSIPLEHTEVRS